MLFGALVKMASVAMSSYVVGWKWERKRFIYGFSAHLSWLLTTVGVPR